MGLSIAGAATFLDAEVTEDSNAALIGKTPTLIPEHEIAVRAEYAFAGQLDGLTLGAGARHRGESYANDANTLTVRSEEHTSELQSLMRISYAVFCLKKKNKNTHNTPNT